VCVWTGYDGCPGPAATESHALNHKAHHPEFTHVQSLLTSEVKVLLEMAKETKGPGQFGDVMAKTLDYCHTFSRFGSKEVVTELRRLFDGEDYNQFEMAQLCNLNCDSPEEAKSLIPSLARKREDELTLLLKQISDLRNVG
jgi:DNA-directed RNA polymerase II subunit RPB4